MPREEARDTKREAHAGVPGRPPPDPRTRGGVGTLTRRQLGSVQVVAGRGAQVGQGVDLRQEHPHLQRVGAEPVLGRTAAATERAGAAPAAGAQTAGGVAARAAAGAQGRGRVRGRPRALAGLAAGGLAGRVRQCGRRRGEWRRGTQGCCCLWLLLLLLPIPPPALPTPLQPPPPPRPLLQTPGSPRRQE